MKRGRKSFWILFKLLSEWSVFVGGTFCRTIPAQALENVTENDDVYRRLHPFGYQQCVKECARSAECGDIRFSTEQLTCVLLRKTPGPYSDVLNDPDVLRGIGNCGLGTCGSYKRCVTLTGGSSFCGNLEPWCPTYIDDRCFKLSEDTLTWTQSKAACETGGQTLATMDSGRTFWRVVKMLKRTAAHHSRVYVGGHTNGDGSPWTWVENGNEINFGPLPSWVNRRDTWRCLMLHCGEKELRAVDCAGSNRYLCQSVL